MLQAGQETLSALCASGHADFAILFLHMSHYSSLGDLNKLHAALVNVSRLLLGLLLLLMHHSKCLERETTRTPLPKFKGQAALELQQPLYLHYRRAAQKELLYAADWIMKDLFLYSVLSRTLKVSTVTSHVCFILKSGPGWGGGLDDLV